MAMGRFALLARNAVPDHSDVMTSNTETALSDTDEALAGRTDTPPLPGTWRQIVDMARWAPSVHNTQAWRVHPMNDSEAEIRYEPGRLLAKTDANGMFYTIGMGIFVEALDVAAGSLGLTVRLLDPVPSLDSSAGPVTRPFARIELRPLEPGASRLSPHLLRQRRTSRVPYDGQPVSIEDCERMAAVGAASSQAIRFTSEPSAVDWVVGLNIDTLFHDLRHRPAREEIGQWIRATGKEARARRDGFSPACIGFSGRLLSTFFHHHRVFDLPGIRQAIRMTYARSYAGTATVGWINGRMDEPSEWFEAGRMLMRFWLTATDLGLVLHPFGSVITNPVAHALMERRLRSEGDGRQTWLLFRIGTSPTPPRSLRLPVDEVLL